MHEVLPGQIWADNDKRAAGRRVQVLSVEGDYANCVVVADRDDPVRLSGRYNCPRPPDWTPVGHNTRILLSRFQPTSNGYRYVGCAAP
ncbi:MAG: hypothetical protein WDN25_13145 [Acetobacteraceae bacterium]